MTNNIELELEYTYLAKRIPEQIKAIEPIIMQDVYFPDTSPHAHLRARRKNDRYEITKKLPVIEGDASTMTEQTIPLEKDEYDALISASTKRVSKLRYKVVIDGFAAEVDIFQDALKGLVLIDFEFSSEQEKHSFVVPEVCLASVTQEEFTAGGYISGKSYEDIEHVLTSYNYHKL